jgi:predicted NAD/FAD-binding protein
MGERIAIVGGGIAGISAAYYLSRAHEVTLFEANPRLGGHACSVKIQEGAKSFYTDTAFLIFNSHSYPRFVKFLGDLGLSHTIAKADMSIGIEVGGLSYAVNAGLGGLFHQRRNILRPKFLSLLSEIRRFREEIEITTNESLRDFLKRTNYSREFQEKFLYPLGASVWSLSREALGDFPAELYFRFFRNHRILKHEKGASWLTMRGGSIQYVEKFRELGLCRLRENSPVIRVERNEQECFVHLRGSEKLAFDRVVLATHADSALRLLAKPTDLEAKLLGAFQYEDSCAHLHHDESVVARVSGKWPSWNISSAREESAFTVSYALNTIQGFQAEKNYFVSIGPRLPDPKKVLAEFRYRHPMFTTKNAEIRGSLPEINRGRTFFTGSYFGNGFHEDAISASAKIANQFGLEV